MCKLHLVVATIVLAALGTSAQAQLVVPPPELAPGDPYRIIFVTAGGIVPGSDDINTYNNFVTNNAQGNATLWALTEEWKAVGSTIFVNARDNTGTNPSESVQVPIYNTRGEKIADNYVDLWDGSIDNAVAYDRDGNIPSDMSLSVLTGTQSNGMVESTACLHTDSVRAGRYRESSQDWIRSGTAYYQPSAKPMYAMSGIIPEPATLAPMLLGGVLLLRRHRL